MSVNSYLERLLGREMVADLRNVRRELPARLAGGLTRALSADVPQMRLRELATFAEQLVSHLNHLCNAEYHARPEVNRELEKELNYQSLKKASFGDLLRLMNKYRNTLGKGEFRIPHLEQILQGKLSDNVAHQVRNLGTALVSRKKYICSPGGMRKYVEDHNRGPVGATTVYQALNTLTEIRNKFAHSEGDSSGAQEHVAWWLEDEEFYRVLNSYILRILCGLLVWTPLRHVLTQIEVVSSLEVGQRVQLSPVRYRASVQRDRVEMELPFAKSFLTHSEPFDAHTEFVAHGCAEDLELAYVTRMYRAPVGRIDATQRRAAYAQYFVAYLVSQADADTGVPVDELSKEEKEKVRDRVLTDWLMVVSEGVDFEHSSRDADQSSNSSATSSFDDFRAWIAREDAATAPTTPVIRRQAVTLFSLWVERIYSHIEDKNVASVSSIASEFGLNENFVLFCTQHLEKLDRAVCDQDGALSGSSTYRIHDPRYRRELIELINQTKIDIEQQKTLPDYLGRLFRLASDLLELNRAQGQEGIGVKPLILRLEEASSTSAEPGDETQPHLRLTIDGQEITAPRLPGLVHQMFTAIKGLDAFKSELKKGEDAQWIPYRVGAKYLVNRVPRHLDESEFGYEVSVGKDASVLFFEADFPDSEAIFHLHRWLTRLNISASIPGQSSDDISSSGLESVVEETTQEQETVLTRDATDGGITIQHGDDEVDIFGPKVPVFMARALQYLVTHRLVDPNRVPFEMGRIRYLLSTAPFHRDESRFTRELEYGGYFLEANLSWSAATKQVAKLFSAMGAEHSMTVEDTFTPTKKKTPLVIRAEDGVVVEGDSVGKFLLAVIHHIDNTVGLGGISLPYKTGSKRFLIAEENVHPSGKDFFSPEELDWPGDRKVYLETHMSRENALKIGQRLFDEAELAIDAVGDAALSDMHQIESLNSAEDVAFS